MAFSDKFCDLQETLWYPTIPTPVWVPFWGCVRSPQDGFPKNGTPAYGFPEDRTPQNGFPQTDFIRDRKFISHGVHIQNCSKKFKSELVHICIPASLLQAFCNGASVSGTSSTTGSEEDEPEEDADEEEEVDTLESFVDWLRRAKHISEDLAKKRGLQDWVVQQRCRKWRLAGHTARRTDGRWSTKLLSWSPTGHRTRGRPMKRWCDELEAFVTSVYGPGADWTDIAQDRESWKLLEDGFAERMCR